MTKEKRLIRGEVEDDLSNRLVGPRAINQLLNQITNDRIITFKE